MRDSLKHLIEICVGVRVFFNTSNFQLFYYEDGAFCEFLVDKVTNLNELLRLCANCSVLLLHDERGIRIRIFEDYTD